MATSLINTECKRYGCIKNLLACYANCRYNSKCDDLRTEILDKTDQAASDINAYLRGRGRAPVTIQILKRGLKFADAANVKKALPAKAERQESQIKKSRIRNKIKSPARIKTSLSAKIESQKAFNNLGRKQMGEPAKLGSKPSPNIDKSNNQAMPAEKIRPVAKIKKTLSASYLEKNQALSNRRLATGGPVRRKRKKVKKAGNKRIALPQSPGTEAKQKKSITMPRRVKNAEIEHSAETVSASNASSIGVERPANTRSKPPRARSRNKNGDSSRSRPSLRNGKVFIIVEGKSANIVDEQGLMQHLLTSASPTARYFEANEVEARLHIVPKR
jgi:hypothetical protein